MSGPATNPLAYACIYIYIYEPYIPLWPICCPQFWQFLGAEGPKNLKSDWVAFLGFWVLLVHFLFLLVPFFFLVLGLGFRGGFFLILDFTQGACLQHLPWPHLNPVAVDRPLCATFCCRDHGQKQPIKQPTGNFQQAPVPEGAGLLACWPQRVIPEYGLNWQFSILQILCISSGEQTMNKMPIEAFLWHGDLCFWLCSFSYSRLRLSWCGQRHVHLPADGFFSWCARLTSNFRQCRMCSTATSGKFVGELIGHAFLCSWPIIICWCAGWLSIFWPCPRCL